jgi:hypothetical protein
MRATKSTVTVFASLLAVGSYLIHPILMVIAIIILIDVLDR